MLEAATIFALSSAPGRAGVAVIRISGPAAGAALDKLAPPRPEPRRAVLRTFRHPLSAEPLDQGLALWLPGPASFTGEDVVELHSHGGRAVVAAILSALATIPGCRLAEAGEFTRRAFENGRLDLTAAEGLADLIDAETEGQRRQALALAGGAYARLYAGWREAVIAAMALTEAAIDFSDEADVGDGALQQARARVRQLVDELDGHLADGHRGEILREGLRVVLAGPPNAGKSSLLNALARREVAIVSHEAGTTRDVIEVRLDLMGWPLVLTDTAGLREAAAAAGEVEREGMRRALAAAQNANLVLWLTACDQTPLPLPEEVRKGAAEVIRIVSKSDLANAGVPGVTKTGEAPAEQGPCLRVSALTGEGMDSLLRLLSARAESRLETGEGLAVAQVRHRLHLETALAALKSFLADDNSAIELRAEDLRGAASALGRITGQIDAEEVLGEIFGRFCIGK